MLSYLYGKRLQQSAVDTAEYGYFAVRLIRLYIETDIHVCLVSVFYYCDRHDEFESVGKHHGRRVVLLPSDDIILRLGVVEVYLLYTVAVLFYGHFIGVHYKSV